MQHLNINRIRVVLADKNLTNRWLAEQLKVTEGTVSRWTTNAKQPPIDTFHNIAVLLKIDIRDLLEPTANVK